MPMNWTGSDLDEDALCLGGERVAVVETCPRADLPPAPAGQAGLEPEVGRAEVWACGSLMVRVPVMPGWPAAMVAAPRSSSKVSAMTPPCTQVGGPSYWKSKFASAADLSEPAVVSADDLDPDRRGDGVLHPDDRTGGEELLRRRAVSGTCAGTLARAAAALILAASRLDGIDGLIEHVVVELGCDRHRGDRAQGVPRACAAGLLRAMSPTCGPHERLSLTCAGRPASASRRRPSALPSRPRSRRSASRSRAPSSAPPPREFPRSPSPTP